MAQFESCVIGACAPWPIDSTPKCRRCNAMSDCFAGGNEMSEPLAPRFDDDPFANGDLIVDSILDDVAAEPLPLAYGSLPGVLATARRPGTDAELTGQAAAVPM